MFKFYTVAHRQQAEKEFGVRQSTEFVKRAVVAARKLLLTTSLRSCAAFPHIATHFDEDTTGKEVHGIFLSEYQQPDALRDIFLRAIDRPGTQPTLSTSDGNWAVLIQTWFGEDHPIGYRRVKQEVKDLSHLLLLVDLKGNPITAYPNDRYDLPGNQVRTP